MSKETKALAKLSLGGKGSSETYTSRSVRKIENGYVESVYDGCTSRERFIETPDGSKKERSDSSLRGAAEYLKRM